VVAGVAAPVAAAGLPLSDPAILVPDL
jgi:hypothetical protein